MKRIVLIAALSLGVGFMTADPSLAVHKNYNNALTCGNCHTMHNSQGSNSLGGNSGGSLIMLRGPVTNRAEIHKFCLQCHASDGLQGNKIFHSEDGAFDQHPAPKVYIAGAGGAGNSAVSGVLDNFASIGAGGDFSGELNASYDAITAQFVGKGHSLGEQSLTPPGGDNVISNFSCTNCHDPHGAYDASTATVNKFRNLRIAPTEAGAGDSVTLNVNITSHIGDNSPQAPNSGGVGVAKFNPSFGGKADPTTTVWPLYDVDETTGVLNGDGGVADQAITNVYAVSAGDATDGISNWCATCHDNWHEDIGGNASGNDWKRHPVDNLLTDATPQSGAGVTIVDTATGYDNTDTLKALPVASINGASGVAYLVSGQEGSNKVFCLSCHFAHGGPYYDNLRWDYLNTVATGDQTGNSIGFQVGCQICHNR